MVRPAHGMKIDGPLGPETIELLAPIGGGGFGVVFEARDSEGQRLAVKFPHTTAMGANELRALRNELAAAGKLEHPNVVQVIHAGAISDEPYLVMEFVSGGTLHDLISERRTSTALFDLNEIQHLLGQLVDGIEAVNDIFVHRDIKPDNILNDNGTLKITDFGLAKLVGAATRQSTFKGMQHFLYKAPESWRNEANTIQMDMYSMGMVMFEVATLRLPYDVPSDFREIEAFRELHLFRPAKLISEFRTDLPNGITQVVARLLEKRPADRYSSWEEVRSGIASSIRAASSPTLAVDVASILNTVSTMRQEETAKQLEQDKAKQAVIERRRVHAIQRKKLLDLFRPAVAEFNKSSQAGAATIEDGGNTVAFSFPHGAVTVQFYDFATRAIPMNGGPRIHFFALVNGPDDQGFNAVLVHKDEADLYGEWEGWEMSLSALVPSESMQSANRVHRHQERFGFDDEEFYDNFRYSRGATHVFNYRRLPDMVQRFVELAATRAEKR